MARDRRLVCFTLGGVLSAVVFGQFTAYLSQYLVVSSSPAEAARLVGYLVTTNAVTVIALQYLIGRISRQRLMPWLLAGMACSSPGCWVSAGRLGTGLVPGDAGVHPGRDHRDSRRVHVHRPDRAGTLARGVLRRAEPLQPGRGAGADDGGAWPWGASVAGGGVLLLIGSVLLAAVFYWLILAGVFYGMGTRKD
jgi:hypothetical protein